MKSGDVATIETPSGAIQMDRCGGRDLVVSIAEQGGWEAFERPLPRAFVSHLSRAPQGSFVDIGANTGFYSLLAAVAGRSVLAFEPDQKPCELLIENVRRNGFDHEIAIWRLALSDRIGTANLYIPDQSHGLIESSASLEAGFKGVHSAVIEVPMSTLDAALPTQRQRIIAVKIDVEGHEAAVLRGAIETVRSDRPVVFVEILPGADFDYLGQFLAETDYVDIPLRSDGVISIEPSPAHVGNAWNHAFIPREQAGPLTWV